MTSLSSPGEKVKPQKCSEEDLQLLSTGQATIFRGSVARANYLSQDRSDIKCAVKTLAKFMSTPRNSDMKSLTHLGPYLKGKPRVVNEMNYQERWKIMDIWCDTDHAGCPWSRKPTSGGVVMFGENSLKYWSSTHAIISLSSGEAEYYGCVKAASTGLGLQALRI